MDFFEKFGRMVDNTIGIFSPEFASKRLMYRSAMGHQKRFYEAATKGRRAQSWKRADSAEREPRSQLKDLRQRSRDASRNNGYGKKAVGAIVANVIGSGIVHQYRSTTASELKVKKANEAFKAFHDSKQIDFQGNLTGPAMQALIMRTVVDGGEVFIRKRLIRPSEAKRQKRFPLALEVLESEMLDESKTSTVLANGNRIVGGIELDENDVRVAYYFHRTHPSDSIARVKTETVRVPADEVIHLYRVDRPGQQRGVPWSHAVLLPMKDLDDFEDAELIRRKIAACFSGFITRPEADRRVAINGSSADDEIAPLIDHLEPGLLQELEPGQQISFATPPNVTGYQEYVNKMLHKLSAGYEIPYSVLTGDYSLVNFSSGRMGWLEFNRLIDQWRWLLFIPGFLEVVRGWFEEVANLWLGLNFSDLKSEWTPPRREMIDPNKEIGAKLSQIKGGLISMPEAIKEMGFDPTDTLEEIEAWNDMLDKKKIILDTDPRQDAKRLTAQNVALGIKSSDNSGKDSGDNQ